MSPDKTVFDNFLQYIADHYKLITQIGILMNIISYSNVTEVPVAVNASKLTGSARYINYRNYLYPRTRRNIPFEIKGSIYNNYLQALKYCDILDIKHSEKEIARTAPNIKNYALHLSRYHELREFYNGTSTNKAKTYKINKSKVRKRLIALCRLNSSKRFLGFYSISFPLNAPDRSLYEIWNKFLTNCRRRYGLKTYVWIAERQKNGTLHFHMLTNNRMNIHKVNQAMAASIDTSVRQGKLTWGQSSVSLYNGVDVDSLQHPKRRQFETREQYRSRLHEKRKHSLSERVQFAIKYMTKYMTKADNVFVHLPFHCSRDVSQLFTSMVLTDQDMERYTRYMSDDKNDYTIYSDARKTVYAFKKKPNDMLFNMLDRVNNYLYEQYWQKDSPS